MVELVGNPLRDYHYLYNGKWKLALIPGMKKQLLELHKRFKTWAKQQVRDGKVLEPPKEWPFELLKLRLEREAILDVRIQEANYLRELIEKEKEKKARERSSIMLEYGPIGMSDRDGGIDGQKINRTSKGVPFIDEPTSPYHLMTLFHYKQMSDAWKKEHGLTRQALNNRQREWHEERVKKAEQEGTHVPGYPGGVDRKGLWRWAKFECEGYPENPNWPKDAKPVTELQEV
ncbi:hypothetical protein [Rhodohalobacter mucosus]|uniref:hypothetical protein n=1 Tax=Rhodohalobacter mucosus TaxID=2079485 RepID=UPI0011B22842|nr:hypothetical protein [Rhodohalobacter mucosus]